MAKFSQKAILKVNIPSILGFYWLFFIVYICINIFNVDYYVFLYFLYHF